MAEEKAYTQAAGTGKYDRTTGLLGKYDNARRFWEDQVTGLFLRPSLNDLVHRKRERLERIRILDIGCGSGDGYDLIMGVNTKDPGIYEYITAAVTPDMLQAYTGIDINEDLLAQAREHYGASPKIFFSREDISDGLTDNVMRQDPFDLYLTTFGTLSHFTESESVKIIADICRHAPDRAIFVGDWLGRYAYEWQDIWNAPADEEYFMDYRISYIYPEEERAQADISSFPLRLMNREEIQRIIDRAAAESGVSVTPLVYYDRSIMVGRHMDTGDYNRHAPRTRNKINALFENYVRTDLESLMVDFTPRQGFDHINNFFEMFFMSCNTLVKYTINLLSGYDTEAETLADAPDIPPYFSEPLKETMHSMRKVIEGIGWLKWGDVRANVIESHLAFSLRKLEMDLQPGNGMGHGLIGIFEIRK